MNIWQTDKLVWELVTSLHAKSSTLKEEVKNRLFKESGIKIRTDAEIRALQAKIRRRQKSYGSMGETLGNLETQLASEWQELAGTAESRKWVNWLKRLATK
jgi:hypothetical protein